MASSTFVFPALVSLVYFVFKVHVDLINFMYYVHQCKAYFLMEFNRNWDSIYLVLNPSSPQKIDTM